ncbi:MAG: hypothetical protein JNK04_15250 [Myxococcales bacterium]|nr:hypothetical protein [Myxococcales bacterium]
MRVIGALALVLSGCGDSGDGGGGSGGSAPQGGESQGGSGGETAQGGSGGGEPQGGSPSGMFDAVPNTFCAPEDTIGRFWISGFPGGPVISGELWETTAPFIGPPTLTTATCGFHEFQDTCPGTCDPGTVCNYAGTCVPERRSVKDASLRITVGGEEQIVEADPKLGGFYAPLEIGDESSEFAMHLTWGELEVDLVPFAYQGAPLADATVTTEGDSSAPGALDATWTTSAAGGHVMSRIPINHHAGGGTFTNCAAPLSAEGFHADAEMIDPLAVITGLEFQGLEYVNIAAAETPVGCIDFRLGEQLGIFPN